MINVGTGAGQVHSERQGTGLATVLTGDKAVDAFGRLYMIDAAKREAADKAAQDKRDAAAAKLQSFAPEYFYQHRETLQPAIQGHLDAGAELLAKKIDPFTSAAPEAVAWQKEHQRLSAMAQNSMQIRNEYAAFRQDTDGKDLSEFTADSVAANDKYFSAPLEDIISGKVKRPILEKKRPWEDASSFIGKNMKLWQEAKPQAGDSETYDFVANLLAQPSSAPIIEAYAQKFNTLDPDEQRRITEAAKKNDREIVQQMGYEDANRWKKSKEPLNLMKAFQDAAQIAESGLDYVEGSNAVASYRQPKKGSQAQSAKNAANDLFNSHDDFMSVFDKNGDLPRMENETDGSYAARVKAYLADQISQRMKVDTKYVLNSDAGKEQQSLTARKQYVEDIQSSDQARATAAAKLLVGTKVGNNLVIESAGVNDIPYRKGLRLEMTTNMTVDEVKKDIVDSETGLTTEDVQVEERQGRKIVFLDLGNKSTANQLIARLYDNYEKETGRKYDRSLTEYSVPTATGPVIVNPAKQADKSSKPGPTLDHLFK